ncbi:MAG: MotA/TolQ/ExbB proton channel family protein [Chitinophagales bacterium]|nr:MotA/TolQ/ExbB proton channel family protein [Chitinophagales bacterium]
MAKTNASSNAKKGGGFQLPAWLIIIAAFIVSEIIFHKVFGAPEHFLNEAKTEAKPGDYLGIVYLGGFVVPFLMTMFITVVAFSIERAFSIGKATGKGKTSDFLLKIKGFLDSGDLDSAISACDTQKGSVANVVQAGLKKYKAMDANTVLTTEQKVLNISKEIEESTTLELPMLQKNLPILSTLASVSTLIALFGTVLGMIRAFAAMATSGSPDPAALAAGISEALINTSIGIFTSAVAIISYNYFSNKIDDLTYSIDEIGFSIAQTFAGKHS